MNFSKYDLCLIESALKSYASKIESWIDHDIHVGDIKLVNIESLLLTNVKELTDKVINEKEKIK